MDVAESDSQKGEVLNRHFSSVFNCNNYVNYPSFQNHSEIGQELSDVAINEEIVRNKLLELDPNKAMGVDNISNKLLIECAESLSKPLSIFFKMMFENGGTKRLEGL